MQMNDKKGHILDNSFNMFTGTKVSQSSQMISKTRSWFNIHGLNKLKNEGKRADKSKTKNEAKDVRFEKLP